MQNMPVSEPSSTVTATQMTSDETTTSYAEPVAPVADSPAPVRQATRPRMGAPMVALAIIMAFVVAIALSRRPSQPVAATAADVQPERLVQSSEFASVPQPAPAPDVAPGAAASVVAPRAVSKAPAKASVLKPKSRITEANGPRAAVTSTAAALNAADSTTSPAASESISSAPAPVSPEPADSFGPGAATITGCLETDGNRFRLTDTEGGDAPRSRSWRSGFLKKRSTAVALVEPPDPGALHKQVGQRVAATGVLTDRELRLTSLRPIGARCN